MPTVEISRIHTTLELSLPWMKTTKHCNHQIHFWALVLHKCVGGRGYNPWTFV